MIYNYTNSGGNKDNIKIEINYSLRAHILPCIIQTVSTYIFDGSYSIRTLDPVEIIASKINALLSRAAARDLYDIQNILQSKFLIQHSSDLLRRCTVFYAAISAEKINRTFNTGKIDFITFPKIKRDLFPVIREKGNFPLDEIKTIVKQFVAELMTLKPNEIEFLALFENKSYHPELLFPEIDILDRIKTHPMALWKMMDHHKKTVVD